MEEGERGVVGSSTGGESFVGGGRRRIFGTSLLVCIHLEEWRLRWSYWGPRLSFLCFISWVGRTCATTFSLRGYPPLQSSEYLGEEWVGVSLWWIIEFFQAVFVSESDAGLTDVYQSRPSQRFDRCLLP